MAELAIQTSKVQVANGDLQINGYLAEPTGEGLFPGIIVFQEIFGVNAHIRNVTERVAKLGYVAIAPNIYQRLVPELELSYTAEDVQLGRTYKDQTVASELLSDTQAAISYLQTLPKVKANALGTLGFCFGGHVAYLAATLPEIKATASFYGAGIATMTPGGGPPTLTRTGEIQGQLYAFFGTQDPSIPADQVAQIEAELQRYQTSYQIFRYPAEHGFFCDQRASYNLDAATDAWDQVQHLFETTLK